MMEETVKEISELCRKYANTSTGVTIIAIDGRGGSGKSTLARSLEKSLVSAHVVEFDDFYYPLSFRTEDTKHMDFNFDWKRLVQEVLIPLRNGQETTYQRYNWTESDDDGLVDGYHLYPSGFIFIEGCYSLRPELLQYYDITIWVETDKLLCRERGIKRSIQLKHHFWDNPMLLNKRWDDFQKLEDEYIKQYAPAKSANIVYDTIHQILTYDTNSYT